VNRRDVVVGIAASGRTPYVMGALAESKHHRSKTLLICFNPNLRFPGAARPDLVLAVNLGPEILTGSTRLKAGTATKLLLNLISTLTMVHLGKVVSNLMVDVKATNSKLRDRARRIVQVLAECDIEQANQALERGQWEIKRALRIIHK
jgi:N-acetylmuramic acid 6-phosphate (MurNAc-6-P) etherase